MPDWESLSSTYEEAVRTTFPLHRIVIVLLGVVCAIAIRGQSYKSITETIVRQPLASLHIGATGFFEHAVVADILFGFLLALFSMILSRFLFSQVFGVAAKAVKLDEKMQGLVALPESQLQTVESLREFSEFIDASLSGVRSKLRALTNGSELAIGLALAAGIAAYWGNVVDCAVSVSGLLGAISMSFIGVRVFLGQYIGPASVKAHLLGKGLPTPSEAL